MKKKGIYAGSFDPLTKGHMWMIETGAKLFDEFIVVLGTNPEKKLYFYSRRKICFTRRKY